MSQWGWRLVLVDESGRRICGRTGPKQTQIQPKPGHPLRAQPQNLDTHQPQDLDTHQFLMPTGSAHPSLKIDLFSAKAATEAEVAV